MPSLRNKTIIVEAQEKARLMKKLVSTLNLSRDLSSLRDSIILGDFFDIAPKLPLQCVDLLILDPPYNLRKNFGRLDFKKSDPDTYTHYLDTLITPILPLLKDTASIYICGDWYTSTSIFLVASKYFIVHNRITWQREKGRGARSNWKNAHEDIWYCTKSKDFVFNLDKIKTRKKVIAPYKLDGKPKDWNETEIGKFRDTHPSNFWDDITIPYWSMAENTIHPTQKPEKLIAKLVLASSNEGDMILDPFVGSGTSCVVAKKLGRSFLGVELDEDFACLSQKRLELVKDSRIQGYSDGVFWERNTLNFQ